jgi:hypothetical protein
MFPKANLLRFGGKHSSIESFGLFGFGLLLSWRFIVLFDALY